MSFLAVQARHDGLSSSHLTLRALQLRHPFLDFRCGRFVWYFLSGTGGGCIIVVVMMAELGVDRSISLDCSSQIKWIGMHILKCKIKIGEMQIKCSSSSCKRSNYDHLGERCLQLYTAVASQSTTTRGDGSGHLLTSLPKIPCQK